MSGRFHTLQRLWEQRLEGARNELGRIQGAIRGAAEAIDDCALERLQAVPTDPAWHPQYADFCRASLGREAAHRHNLRQFEQLAEQQRTRVQEALRQERTFALLQEREDRRLARRKRRQEEHRLQEFALQRWRAQREEHEW